MRKEINLFIKIATVLAVFITSSQIYGQKYYTKTGNLKFEASAAAFEPVAAEHTGTTAVLETSSGKLAVLALVRGFHFRNALMEEHFNENYIESDKFPKASFSGSIENFDRSALNEKESFNLAGKLTLRGKAKDIATKAMIKEDGSDIHLTASFIVSPQDFDIDIPKVVREKIAEEIEITVDFVLVKK